MGKATIISHAGKGLYSVDVAIETQYIQQQIDKVQEEHTRLHYVDFPEAEAEKISEELKLASAQHDVDIAISNYYADPTDANYSEIQRLTQVALNQSQAFRIAKDNYEAILTRIDALRRRLETLRSNNQKYKRSALWCIDLADGKKDRKLFYPGDEVGTAEISGDIDTGQNLLASYVPGWEYDIQRDGILVNTNGLTPFEFLYDNTLFPPWQKWKHRYRSATITDGNPTDGWTILLDDTKSTEQAIEVNTVNASRTLTGIHAVYMNCNDNAFGFKDHVVVDLTVSGPGNATVLAATIIGFVEKPKPCLTSGFGYYALHTSGTPSEWQHINDETGVWVKQPSYANDLTAHAMDGGGEPTIRSWIGDDVDSEAPVLEFLTPSIYLSGNKIADRPSDRSWSIIGAALSPNRKFLWAVFCDGPISNKISLGRYPITEATPVWEMEEFNLGANAIIGSIEGQFSFNASCTRALSMWGFVHGAKRTPQATPGGGAAWNLPENYNDTWKEKLEISITSPDASTMVKAGVSLTNHGRQGYNVWHYKEVINLNFSGVVTLPIEHNIIDGYYTRTYTYPWTQNTRETNTYLGSYQFDVGFNGDTEIAATMNGAGTVETNSSSGEGITAGEVSGIPAFIRVANGNSRGSGTTGFHAVVGSLSALPIKTRTINTSFSGSNHSDGGGYGNSSTSSYDLTIHGTVSILDMDSQLIAHDYAERTLVSTITCNGGTEVSSSTDTTVEKGSLWCGAPIDASIGDPVVVTDGGTQAGVTCFDVDYPVFTEHGLEYWVDIYSDSGPAPDYQLPENPWGDDFGLSFSHTTEYFYDVTEYATSYYGLFDLTITQAYEKIQGARAAGRKHMAYWQNTRTPGSVREYKAYLTGGDPFTLDGLTGDVIYRAIHPL